MAALPADSPPVQFRGRPSVLTLRELDGLLAVCPPPDAFRTGFVLPDSNVDEIIRVAKDIEGAQVLPDPSLAAEQNVGILSGVVRLLQLALDVQFQESEEMARDLQELEGQAEQFSERERKLTVENERMRELRDREQQAGDIVELRKKNDELTRSLESERAANTRLRDLQERDEKRSDRLDDQLKRVMKDLDKAEDDLQSSEERYNSLLREHNELTEAHSRLSAEHAAASSKLKLDENGRQTEWKLERLSKENRALELQNTELRKQVQDTKAENLEVSEKIVLLDDECRNARVTASGVESRMEALAQDKASLIDIQDQLRADIQDKMALLNEFEDKFNRQYKSWEEEKSGLLAQIEGLKRELYKDGGGGAYLKGKGGGGGDDGDIGELRDALNEAKEKEILLLEAYEQLERDVGREVDRALARQAEEVSRLQRRVDFLQSRLEDAAGTGDGLRDQQAALETRLKDAAQRAALYEAGVYGLPQAVEEIRALQETLVGEEGRNKELVTAMNKLSAKVEDLYDENSVLRKAAGISDSTAVDIKDIRMQKESSIAQLRSLNALLERQVADLEEERRKLRMEMKFRAKYHGQAALSLGLSPEQLLLVEQYVDDLKGLRNDEARLVDQLQKRIEFLEVRLSEVMAYADIPPSMRPELSELNAASSLFGAAAGGKGGRGGGGGGVSHIQVAQVEAVRATLLKALGMLRQMHQSLVEKRNVPDQHYAKYVDGVSQQLTDAEKTISVILRDLTAANAAGGVGGRALVDAAAGSGVLGTPRHARSGSQMPTSPGAAGSRIPELAGDAGFLADALADELREKLRDLARQVADLQVVLMTKDAHIAQLVERKTAMERKYGVPVTERQSEYVSNVEYEDLSLVNASLKEQLISTLEELSARETEAGELHDAGLKYQAKMQTYVDQIRMLYREYATASATWKVEKHTLEKKSAKLAQECDGYKAAAKELQIGLDTLTNKDPSAVQREYVDTVRRMALVQIKHAKVARELGASVLCEKQLQERVGELEEEVRDISSTARGRMRWLEAAAEQAQRRVESLFRELEGSAPLQAYQLLVSKYARVQGELRRLVEERGDALAVGHDELFRLRDDLTALMAEHARTADDAASMREKLRQLALSSGPREGGGTNILDTQLSAELVASRVNEESLARRAVLVEKERDRGHRTLQETQDRLRELEERVAQSSADLTRARANVSELQAKLLGTQSKEVVDGLMQRLAAAEAAAAEVARVQSNAAFRAQDAEGKVASALRDHHRHLAEITNLRSALRDAMARGDQAAVLGKLHLELDHSRAKEGLARNALNRSELQRLELEKDLRKARSNVGSLSTRLASAQEQTSWSDKQRHEAQAALEVSLAGCTEAWKAKLWTRKLEQLKARNDALADGLDLARERIQKLETVRIEMQLRTDYAGEAAALSKKGPSEAAREAARLTEQLLTLRMDKGKRQREEVLLKEKVHYTERVNAELHELLERYESEFYGTQVQLEGERQAALARAKGLQDEVGRLQDRMNVVLATHGYDGSSGGGGGEEGAGGRHALGRGTDKGAMVVGSRSERDTLLKQIDKVKVARQEGENLKTECQRLQSELSGVTGELADVRRHHKEALQRLHEQSEALLYALNHHRSKGGDETAVEQMKAVAEATIMELKGRVKERDGQLASLHARLQDELARFLAQHQADRREIERLNQKLFERNDASINDLKGVLDRMPLKTGGGEAENDEHMRLRDALQRAQDEAAALRLRADQKEAALAAMRCNHELQMRRLQDELSNATREFEAHRPRDDTLSRAAAQQLNSQIRDKDAKLRQLKAAIKELEAKLIKVMKDHADGVMQEASWLAQERLEKRVGELEAANAEAAAEAQLLRDQLEAARAAAHGGDLDAATHMLRDELQRERDRNGVLEVELTTVRMKLQRMKNARESVVDLTTGMSIEAKRQIEELEKRLHVLEQQNKALKRAAADYAAGTSRPGGGGGDNDEGRGGGGGSARDTARSKSGRNAGPSSRPPLTSDLRRSSHSDGGQQHDQTGHVDLITGPQASRAAVAAWEESKRMNVKLDALRKKLAAKGEEVTALQREADRRSGQITALQMELDKQAAVIRDLQERQKRTAATASTASGTAKAATASGDSTKVLELAALLTVTEEQRDQVQLQLAQLQQQVHAASAQPLYPPGSVEDQLLERDAELYKLQLQQGQAQAQVKRLRDRIADLTGSTAAGQHLAETGGSSSGKPRSMSVKEAELLSTIANLKVALEKATANTTPTTKYMQEVGRRKEAQEEAKAVKAEAEKSKQQLQLATRMIGDLQASNAEQRTQLRALQAASLQSASSTQSASVQAMEQALAQKDRELHAMRQALAERVTEGPSMTATEVQILSRQMKELEAENADLRKELDAFDPDFFDEIEDLKHDHHVLSGRVVEYEGTITRLTADLGLPPPVFA